MPTTRKLTPEELADLQAQGIDMSQYETEVEVLTPEEEKQHRIQQALGNDTGRGAAISNTLKAHTGSYVGGGVGAGLGMIAGAALAPETFGLSLLIPALTTAAGGAAGGYAGGKLQQAILPEETEARLQEKASASHELYPWTTGATDLLAGTIAGGGKPNLKNVRYALRGANEAIQSGVVSTIPYRQALQNVTVGNAVGAGVNTGLQLAQTGEVDPREVALNLVGGAFMSEPSALGRKLSGGHWKPLANVRGIEAQSDATPVTVAKSGIKNPEGHVVPENVEEVVARNTKAEEQADEATEYERQWQQKAAEIEAEQNRIIAEHQAKQQKMADLFAKNDWRNADLIPDKAVKKAFYNRFKQTPTKGMADLEIAAIDAANKRVKEVPVEAMRQELWEQDFANYDSEGFNAYKAKQKAAQEAAQQQQVQKAQQIRVAVDQQNAAIAEAQARQQRLNDFLKAQKERIAQQAEEQRIAKQLAEEQAKAEFQAKRQQQLRGQLNPNSVAEKMQSGIVAPEQRPTPFELNRFKRPFNEVKGEPTTAEEMQAQYDKEQGDKYQAPTAETTPRSKATPELLHEAAKSDVEVGQLPEDEALPHPQGGEARGINFSPESIGRRLFALSRTATSDTGYHELLHSTLRDMRQSDDPALRRLAQRIESAMGGEEPFVQAAGEEYETAIKRAAGATFNDKVGEWFKNAWATAKTMAGSEDPATLRRNLIALTTRRAGRGQDYLLSTVEGGRGVPSRDEYSDKKDDTLEGYRKVTVRRPDGTTYDANFNDKYYTSKGGEKLASLAFKQENGEWTHGMAKSGEKIEEGNQYQGPQTETPEFKKWFGDSKVVNSEGKPLVVYHGTQAAPFYEFKEGFGQAHGIALGKGIYFASSKESAEKFGNNQVHEVFLRMNKPFDLRLPENRKLMWDEKGIYPHIERLRKEGKIDGIIDTSSRGAEYGLDFIVFNPEQIKSAIGNRGTYNPTDPDIRYQAPEKAEPNALLPFLTSRVDKIAKRFNDETGHYVATTLHKFSGYADLMIGRIGNKLVSIGRDLTPEQLDKVYHHLHDIDNTGSSEISLTSNESRVAKAITEALREPRRLQQKEGLLVKQGGKLREAGIKPEGYMFNILDRDVAYEWAEYPDSAKAKAYDEAYIEHQKAKGADDEEAAELLAEYKGALGSQLPGGVEFGALRRAEGNGLPWELVDKNFASASMRYARRAARDLSFFKFLQNDSKMRKALNLEDQEGRLPSATDEPTIKPINGSQEVQEAMRSVYSIDTPRSKVLMAAARAVGNAVMGVGTAVRNIANIPAFLGAYVQTGQIPKVFEAISKMNESRARAFENNAVRTSFKDFDAAGYVQQDPNPLVNLFNKFTDYARKYQGRDFSDKFEGEFYYSLGELLAVDNIAKAKTGNAESRRFVKRFGDIVEGGSERLLSGEVTQDDISRIAKRFVDGARGTYSEEGLPSWAIEGEIAPFTALSRFSIEKANTIYKDVVVPAREGNYAPLLRYTLASLGVGLGIEELNELLSGKRGPDPKLNEVLAAGDAEDLTAKAVGLLQLASFAGIVSDGAKAALQISNGKSRFSSPLSFPLYTLVTDTIAGNLGDAVDAIHQGENPFDVMGELAINVASQSVQTLRYVDNNLLRPEDTARREKFRDVEVFKDLEGGNTSETTGGANPYLGINSRKFKRATNIDEALQLLPGLINKAFEKAGGDIEKLRNELRKLKNVSYQTMPSLENAPLGFLRYLNYLKITQGEQAMSERLRDYLEQNAINDVKAQMVP